MDASGDLHPLVELQVKDIFRRLDKIMINNSLEFPEFQEFFQRINVKFTEEDFRKTILKKFCSSSSTNSGAVNRRGFLGFFKDAIQTQGEAAVWRWLDRWGFDRELFPQEARSFMLTLHSMQPIAVQIEEAVPGNRVHEYDSLVNRIIV